MLPYKLDTTNDLLTSRVGLLATGQLLESLNLAERIDRHFPLPKSNRGYPRRCSFKHWVCCEIELTLYNLPNIDIDIGEG